MTGTSPRASVSETRVWQFAVLPNAEAYWRSDPYRIRAFLGYRSVVDHQHGMAADELIRLNQQFCLQRPGIPDPGGNEVVQLITCAER